LVSCSATSANGGSTTTTTTIANISIKVGIGQEATRLTHSWRRSNARLTVNLSLKLTTEQAVRQAAL
jgi:hypothetical protein